jgi:hypothetical protein
MKNVILTSILLLTWTLGFSQSKKINWQDVKVYEFTARSSYPDTLEICGGEWFVKGKANNIKELSRTELKRIKKKVAKYSCYIVYVDTKKVYTPRSGQLYILGLKGKE